MKATVYPTLANFLGAWFPEADLDGSSDEQVAKEFAGTVSAIELAKTIEEGRLLLGEVELPLAMLSRESNRRFPGPEAAREWLRRLIHILEAEAVRKSGRQVG
jgi:hypothetical protein